MDSERSTDRKFKRALEQASRPHQSDLQRQTHMRQAAGLALSKRMWLRPFAVDLADLPQDIDLTAPKALAKLFLGLAVFFFVMTGIPFLILLQEPEMPWWGVCLAALFPTLCLAIIIFCFRAISDRRFAHFESNRVTVTDRRLFGGSEWTEHYSNFDGVTVRDVTIDTRYDRATFQIVELVHGDPEKSVPLAISNAETPPHAQCAAFAEALGLSVI